MLKMSGKCGMLDLSSCREQVEGEAIMNELETCETCGDSAKVVVATYELQGYERISYNTTRPLKSLVEVCEPCLEDCRDYRPHHSGLYLYRLVA
jgi:hypothetical protein